MQELDGYEENAYNYVRITGVTHIRPAQGKIENNLRVDLLITASDPQLSYVEKTDSQLVIRTPRGISKHSWDSRGSDKPYVRIDATIWVSPGAILQNFDINVQSLSIVCYTGLKLNARRVMLSTLTGHITLPPDHAELITTDSREIIIHSTFGSIEGTYPLYDLLSITTVSGSISILISPQEALDSNTKPAKLILQSASGSIQADTPVAELTESKRLRKIPHRDYTSSVSSASGSIYANILHTSKTTIQTASGRISAYIHPHGPPSLPSLLVTDSASSATNVKVYPSLSHPLIPLQALSASHRVFSGSINLTYPNEWEGSIHAKTISGTLGVDWPRVNIVKDVKGVVGREIEALRGHGQGRLEFETTSGSAFLGGDGEPGWVAYFHGVSHTPVSALG